MVVKRHDCMQEASIAAMAASIVCQWRTDVTTHLTVLTDPSYLQDPYKEANTALHKLAIGLHGIPVIIASPPPAAAQLLPASSLGNKSAGPAMGATPDAQFMRSAPAKRSHAKGHSRSKSFRQGGKSAAKSAGKSTAVKSAVAASPAQAVMQAVADAAAADAAAAAAAGPSGGRCPVSNWSLPNYPCLTWLACEAMHVLCF